MYKVLIWGKIEKREKITRECKHHSGRDFTENEFKAFWVTKEAKKENKEKNKNEKVKDIKKEEVKK